MERISVLGVDLAKNIFQVHGVAGDGRVVVRKQLSRSKLTSFVANLSPCLIGMEASSGARHWVREFKKLGHDVRLMAPQFVKPFIKSDKNDANDAEGICEAVQRPNMRFVVEKSIEQQQIQMLHRIRSRRVASRTELCNEIRGLLADCGVTAPKGLQKLRDKITTLLDEKTSFIWLDKELDELVKDWNRLDEGIHHSDLLLAEVFEKHEVCRRLETIPGIGTITATAIVGAVADINSFKSGRNLAAWLGLVPRQNSSGGKQRLSGITKRGEPYLRTLLIHGGRTVVKYAANKTDRRSKWIAEKIKTRGRNKAAVAVANKNARVIWKIMRSTEVYREF